MLRRSVRDSRLRHRSRSTHIAGRSSKNMRRGGGRMHGSSETSERLQVRRLAKLTSFLADSLAKTFPSLVSKRGYETESAAAYSLSCCGLLGSYDRERSSWRTSQISLLPDWTSYLERLPRSGMTVSGKLYALPMLAHRISASDGSAWESVWATPTVQDGENCAGISQFSRNSLPLNAQIWATPTTDDANNVSRKSGVFKSLTRDVQTWATPNAADHQGTHGGGQGRSLRTDTQTMRQPTEALNPDWVELLMGYPVGWTFPDFLPDQTRNSMAMSHRGSAARKSRSNARRELKRSEMQLCRSRRSRFLKRCIGF